MGSNKTESKILDSILKATIVLSLLAAWLYSLTILIENLTNPYINIYGLYVIERMLHKAVLPMIKHYLPKK